MIQPLIGGEYIGTRDSLGCDADMIISFPGLEGNEKSLHDYLEKKNVKMDYRYFEKGPFDYVLSDMDTPEVKNLVNEKEIENLDLVMAVPVCAGLSSGAKWGGEFGTPQEVRDARNTNFNWIANYTLGYLKPKVYCFENAYRLTTNFGEKQRLELEEIAQKYGYSVTFARTNVLEHGTPQNRMRTFTVFWKWPNGKACLPPKIDYETNHVLLREYLKMIPEEATQKIPYKESDWKDPGYSMDYTKNIPLFKFLYSKFGDGWRQRAYHQMSAERVIYDNDLAKEYIEFLHNDPTLTQEQADYLSKYVEKHDAKIKSGLGYFDRGISYVSEEYVQTIYGRSLSQITLPDENRSLNMREAMWLMNMPMDFEYTGPLELFITVIGQNVCPCAAKWIVNQIKYVLEDWDTRRTKTRNTGLLFGKPKNVEYFDNIAKTSSYRSF